MSPEPSCVDTSQVQDEVSFDARSADVRRLIQRGAAVGALVIGLVVTTGWLTDMEAIRRPVSGLVGMKLSTALLFVALATSFLVGRRRVASVLHGVVLVVAVASLAQVDLGMDLGIDRDVVAGPDGSALSGRTSATTAVCFIMLVLGAMAVRGGWRVAPQIAGAFVSMTGWLAMLGYLFGAEALYRIGPLASVAFRTALALFLLGVALQAAVPDGVLSWVVAGRDLGAQTARRLLPIALLVVPFLARGVLTATNAGWVATEFSFALVVLAASLAIIGVALPLGRDLAVVDAARAQVADELAAANVGLERRVDERTAALADSEARARSLALAAPVGIFHTDPHGKPLYVNARWCEIFGSSLTDDLLDVWNHTLHRDDRDRVTAAWSTALATASAYDCEYRIVITDGDGVPIVRWLHARASVVLGADGSATGFAGTVEDTTDRRAAEAQFRAAFESAPIGMALVAPGGRIMKVNTALCRMLGRSSVHLEATSTYELLQPEGDDLAEVVDLTGGAPRERRVLRPDGSDVWVAVQHTTVLADGLGEASRYALMQFVDVTEQRQYAERMAHLANHDSLTGLLNRRSFESALEQHVDRVARYGVEGAVLVLDIDHFKRINDLCGHSVGDQVIVHVAAAIRERLRASDIVARLGGDEFAVLLPSGGPEDARHVADALVGAVRSAAATISGRRLSLSTSVGIAAFDDAGRAGDEMMVRADLAMYDAKEEGRDRWVEYSGDRDDQPHTKARLSWIERIERALDDDRFVLHAQPIVDLGSGQTVSLELLVRMIGDRGETIPPASFLYVAERYGLIGRLDAWVLARALDVLDRTEGGPPLSIATNISGPSLGDPTLLAMIEEAVHAGRFEPSRLVLEVTETSAVRNIGAARIFAERLRGLGCRFALDDFGSGFGSFTYLKHLPFDFIKIDGEFVSKCVDSPTDQAIIRSLVGLARDLGKQTIAEHVPDDHTVWFLRRLGVDHGQGFHLGYPVELDQAVAAVATGRVTADVDRVELVDQVTGRAS